jgi:hypothetical protein
LLSKEQKRERRRIQKTTTERNSNSTGI